MICAIRHAAAALAILMAGLANVPWVTAAEPIQQAEIGDPWWDEAAPATPAEADPKAPPAEPIQQAHERARRFGQQTAMNVLRRELSAVRAACPSLSSEDRAAIMTAGLRAVDVTAAVKQPIVRGDQRVNGIIAPGGAVQGRMRVVPSPMAAALASSIGEAVANAVAEVAPAAEAEAYRREVTARADRRRAAAVAVLVEAVDQTAMLDDTQREALAAAFAAKWQPAWEQVALQASQVRFTGGRLPPGVVAVVADVLGPEEFFVWQERLRRP